MNGRNGNVLWRLKDDTEDSTMAIINLYTVNSVRDLDSDNVADVLAVHVEERRNSRAGHIKIISGKDGKIIRSVPTPFNEEVFVPIQIITQFDGTECLLVVTGGQSSSGGVYLIRIHELMVSLILLLYLKSNKCIAHLVRNGMYVGFREHYALAYNFIAIFY